MWGGGDNKSDDWGSSSATGGGWGADDWGTGSNEPETKKNSSFKGNDKPFGRRPRREDQQDNRGNESSSKDDGWGSSSGTGTGGGGGWGDDSNERGTKRSSPSKGNDTPFAKRTRREGQETGGDDNERPAPYRPEELDIEEEVQIQADGTGENFQKYSEHKVTCFPKDVITPIDNFEDVVKSELLLANIKSQRYSEMTPIQKWAMPALMEGHDLIGCAQTGSGKTAAFLLPVLQTLLSTNLESDANSDCQNPYCLIISPTRELARQLHLHATILSKDSIVKCHYIFGQISTAHLKARLSTGCHILVATPGRLKDFLQRGWIGFKNIKYVILDEGDRLVDEGFTSDIDSFFNHEDMPPKEKRQTLFFSATFQKQTQLNAKKYLKDDFIFLTVGRIGAANEDIKQEFICTPRQEKKRELKKILDELDPEDKAIIFTQTKNGADILAGYFTSLKLESTSIHGDRHQSQRDQAIKAFKKGEKRFLISSPVGNRGLDLPKVALVINYDLPSSIDEYVHRIGRTGRAGHIGRAISFYDEERNAELVPDLIEILTEAKQEIPDWLTNASNGNAAVTNDNDDWGSSALNNGDNEPSAKTNDDNPPSAVDEEW